jgi:quercetin dioxygenase-like cupin family protein
MSFAAAGASPPAIIAIPDPLADIVRQHSRPGVFVGSDSTPWVPRGGNAFVRHLAFDVRNNFYATILWVTGPGRIGTHRHRGSVYAVGLEGSFRYLEHDWVCRAGDFLVEMPGHAHTLVTDEPEGMKALFMMQGANDFFDEEGRLIETTDVFWFIDHYTRYCRENDLPINTALWL